LLKDRSFLVTYVELGKGLQLIWEESSNIYFFGT
jgi:hypothetical protein